MSGRLALVRMRVACGPNCCAREPRQRRHDFQCVGAHEDARVSVWHRVCLLASPQVTPTLAEANTMVRLRSLALLAAPIGVALVAWSCERQPNALAPNIGTPLAHFQPGNFVCTPLKMTGGGRIDYP